MERSKGWLIFKIIVFYCFLASGRATMTLGDNPYIDLLLSIIALMVIPRHAFIHTPQRMFASFFLAIAAMYTMRIGTFAGIIAQFSMVFIPIQLIFLKRELQIDLFNTLCKWFAILLIASAIWWFLWLLNIPLPHISQQQEWQYNDYGSINENYILFLNIVDLNPYLTAVSFHRFNGFFLEPGHIGSICALFLYANKFNLKKWTNCVFLFIVFISFSAAAYALAVIGYCFYRYTIDQWKVVLPIALIGLGIYFITEYNGGDNELNEIVLGKFTRESGAVEGRFSENTQRVWDDVVAHGNLLFGVGITELTQSSGYKVFLIWHGIFGALLVLIAYWKIQKINCTRLGVMFFALMVISFLQRVYCFWDAFLDPYILGTVNLLYLSELQNNGEAGTIAANC